MKLNEAEELNIEVVDPTIFFDAIDKGGNAIELIVEKNIAPWGGNVNMLFYLQNIIYICNYCFILGKTKNRKKAK